MRLIRDPLYLSRQPVVDVKEHQVKGLLPTIKQMVSLCLKSRLGAMAAPEVGLPYNFFVAENPDPTKYDYDVVFSPQVWPVTESYVNDDGFEVEAHTLVLVEEASVNGCTYKVPRWPRVKMKWLHHNGEKYEEREGVFEGDHAYIAQQQYDRLHSNYVGTADEYEEVEDDS